MKLALELAYKNLIGAGLKTWLNVGILAFTYLLIVFYNGFMDGWNRQSVKDSIAWENGHGQVWHEKYDPSDPFTILDGHGSIPEENSTELVPVLVRMGTIYPEGRMLPISIKGIPAEQSVLKLPSEALASSESSFPIIVGEKFANYNDLQKGGEVLLRWRDKNGTFDAANAQVVDVFKTDVSTVDVGQVWMDLGQLQEITGLAKQASYLIASKTYEKQDLASWKWKSNDELLAGLFNVIKAKKASGSIMYILLLGIALLAIFDTQVLSIFRRQKEIGTYVSLGMTRVQVMKLFTTEGAMYSIMAAIAAVIVGIPLLGLAAYKGIPIPEASQATGVSISGIIFPYFGVSLILTTFLLVVIAATIVSYLPSRKIARMDPVNALKGKIQ